MKALRKIAVILVVIILAFGPLLAVIPAFGQVTDPHPPVQYTYVYTEGISMQIDAPEGYVFTNVIWADFGNPYYDKTTGEYLSDPDCSTPFSTPKRLLDLIFGETSVNIAADSDIYGNPCPEYQQSLGYTIEATFLESSPTPTQTPTEKPTEPSGATETPTPLPSSTATPTPSQLPVEPSATTEPTQVPESPEKPSYPDSNAWVGLSPEAREKAQKVVVATIIVSQIAMSASMIRKRK